jgi:hypothetical protein
LLVLLLIDRQTLDRGATIMDRGDGGPHVPRLQLHLSLPRQSTIHATPETGTPAVPPPAVSPPRHLLAPLPSLPHLSEKEKTRNLLQSDMLNSIAFGVSPSAPLAPQPTLTSSLPSLVTGSGGGVGASIGSNASGDVKRNSRGEVVMDLASNLPSSASASSGAGGGVGAANGSAATNSLALGGGGGGTGNSSVVSAVVGAGADLSGGGAGGGASGAGSGAGGVGGTAGFMRATTHTGHNTAARDLGRFERLRENIGPARSALPLFCVCMCLQVFAGVDVRWCGDCCCVQITSLGCGCGSSAHTTQTCLPSPPPQPSMR